MRCLHWPQRDLLVAGDSLNDLSLFRLGAQGAVVGNAEPALGAQVAGDPLVHRPAPEGAAAVLNALERLGWVRSPRRVVIGYHRPPWQRYEGRWRPPASPHGILPTPVSALEADTGDLDAVPAAATNEDAAVAATPPGTVPEAALAAGRPVGRGLQPRLRGDSVARPDLPAAPHPPRPGSLGGLRSRQRRFRAACQGPCRTADGMENATPKPSPTDATADARPRAMPPCCAWTGTAPAPHARGGILQTSDSRGVLSPPRVIAGIPRS
ncbi:HAD family hydrolase [Streptomyces roseus]|uniref:HAD family hydrolase n=1 Tax=Streptomyces roseus TaxID=66430 RepID=UPI00368F68D9